MVLLACEGAIFSSTAAIVPCLVATSRIAETPFLGSITWPPFSNRSYWLCAPAQDTRTRRSVDRMASAFGALVRRFQDLARARADDQSLTGPHGHRNGKLQFHAP